MSCITATSVLKPLFFLSAASLFTTSLNSSPGIPCAIQNEPVRDEVFVDNIHTVLIRNSAWELSRPVFELGSEQKLELLFDDLSGIPKTYIYSMVHCDVSWNRSGLQINEYLTGTGQGTIHESASSINTTHGYIHYRLEFPEEDCIPVLSGNYVLEIYDSEDPENILLTRRFYVVEKLVQISGKVRQAPPGDYRETGQKVEFSFDFGNMKTADPLRDLAVVVKQNGRDDRTLYNLKPSIISPGRMEFDLPETGIFQGGNEFRTLDIKSMKYQTENVANIDFRNPYYHVYLKPDKSRDNKPYFSKADLNGNFFIDQEKARQKHLEADYVYVHFCLDQSFPLEENVFVFGGLTGWGCSNKNKMVYNETRNCYESVILLKQGLYDYDYALTETATGMANEESFEGNFYETGNDYEIYIYLHDNRRRYDRLIGYLPLKNGN